jgi:hypothetical protein
VLIGLQPGWRGSVCPALYRSAAFLKITGSALGESRITFGRLGRSWICSTLRRSTEKTPRAIDVIHYVESVFYGSLILLLTLRPLLLCEFFF